MRNEVRINVYVGRISRRATSASRVGGRGVGAGACGGPAGGRALQVVPRSPRGIDYPHGAQPQPLYILTGVLTPALFLSMNFTGYANATASVSSYATRLLTTVHTLLKFYTSYLHLKLRHTFRSLAYSSLLSLIM